VSRPRTYRAIAALPSLALLVGVPLLNGVRAYVLGLPFLLFWIVAWVLLTSVVMAIVATLDRARDREASAGRAGPGAGNP
jgi:uncharacterized membrane protein